MCLKARVVAEGDSEGDLVGDRSWERAPPPRAALARRKRAAARREAVRRATANSFAILGEIEEVSSEEQEDVEAEVGGACRRSPCLGAFMEGAFVRTAGEGLPPADSVAALPDLCNGESRRPQVRLDSEAEFPPLPQLRGSAAPLVVQVLEEGSSSPLPEVLIGEIPVPLVREPAAPPSEEGERL
jgi:hypothetical protein